MPIFAIERDMSCLGAIISPEELASNKFRALIAGLQLELDDARRSREETKTRYKHIETGQEQFDYLVYSTSSILSKMFLPKNIPDLEDD